MQGLDNINLFSIITMISFAILVPVALFIEGVKFMPSTLRAMGIFNTGQLYKQILIAALCFHSYQQVCLIPKTLNPQSLHPQNVTPSEYYTLRATSVLNTCRLSNRS